MNKEPMEWEKRFDKAVEYWLLAEEAVQKERERLIGEIEKMEELCEFKNGEFKELGWVSKEKVLALLRTYKENK